MAVVNVVVGATSPSTATVVAKVDTGPVRIAYQDDPFLSSPSFTGSVAVDGQGVAKVLIEGLDENTKYFFQVEDNSVLDTTVTGSLRTHPPVGQAADFTVAFGGCAGSTPAFPAPSPPSLLADDALSNSPVFGHILDADPLWFSHMGDLHYGDIGEDHTANVANYRAAYDDVLAQPEQAALYRQVAWQYVWDNHDFGRTGPNTSDGTFAGKADAQQVFRERVPHYPLTDPEGIWQQWRVGRVQFVALDSRSYRDPNLDPDTESKTMLGTVQRAWLADLLSDTPAVFLVLISPSVWHNPAEALDTWESFQSERSQLIELFTDTGFIDRMCVIWGDRHAMGMGSGTFIPGGMPGMQFTALDDSTPPAAQTGWFDTGPESSENGQWGTVRINDLGDTLELTATGYVMDNAWRVMNVTFDLTEPEPEPEPEPDGGLPSVGTADPRTEVTWLGCSLMTGQIIAEIPDMSGPVTRALGAYTSPRVRIPIPRAGEASKPALPLLLQATEPTRTMIVAVVNNIPMFAGIPLIRRGGTDGRLELALVSIEGYLARRFVRDHAWTDQDESSVIAAGLIGDAGDIPGVGSGINLIIDTPATGTLRDRTYLAGDHSTVYERLRQLMGVRNGPEWTIDLDWTDASQTAVSKIFRMRKRIGVASDAPEAIFDTSAASVFSSQGASNARYEYAEDRTDGRYANYMVAYSVGEGEDQPVSDPAIDQVALDAGAPIWERHWMPSSSITEVSTLNDHATSDLERLKDGVNIWSIESRWDAYPRYGVDWKLGDDVAWRLTGHRHPRPVGEPSSPGVVGQGRVIGFELNIETGIMQPILLRPGAEVIPE